ncbi:MAG: hypothetical protein HY929_07750 [Euryarchaeota archaeon]|nr:hypothetical protein [Euryarchaeota archaeon]
MIVIDSNIWNYYFDETTKENKFIIKALDKSVKKEEIAINTVILIKVSHYLVKRLGPKEGKSKIEKIPRIAYEDS